MHDLRRPLPLDDLEDVRRALLRALEAPDFKLRGLVEELVRRLDARPASPGGSTVHQHEPGDMT